MLNMARACRHRLLSTTWTKKLRWRFQEGRLSENCRVLFAGEHFHASIPLVKAEIDRRNLAKNVELIHAPSTEGLYRMAPTVHVALPFMERFPADFFERSPLLRLVIQFGVGLEGVDIDAASERGVAVSNIPADGTGNAQATSEHAIFLAISLLRHTVHELPRRFLERSLGGLPIPRSLYGKRVTVVGYGAVGSCLTRYLVTMGADVTVVRRRRWQETSVENDGDQRTSIPFRKATSLEEALPDTQILFLACTLTPETLHCINGTTIGLLPRGALVVNIARGGLVQYDAMHEGLRSGAVGGFASDVGIGHRTKPSEPWDPDDEISCTSSTPFHRNVVFTPHVGGYTDYSYAIMSAKVVDAIEHAVRGEPPPVWVNRPSSDDETHVDS